MLEKNNKNSFTNQGYFFKKKRGFVALFITISILGIMLAMAISITVLILAQERTSVNITKSNQAYYTAEAGIEDAIYRIKASISVSPHYNMTIGLSSVDILVDSPSQNNRIITTTGNNANAFKKLETRLTVTSVNPEFFYGAQAGELGIKMDNNSRVEGAGGVAGNIYSNGSITGANGAVITGDVFVATGMTEDQTHLVYNSDQIFGQASPIIDMAQSFKPSVSDKLTKISIYVKKVGNPGNKTVRILTDSSGSPAKTVLASATLQSNLIGTSFGWVDVVFPTPPSLAQGTNYWMMIDTSKDNNDYLFWGKDQNQGYGNGVAKYTNDWNAASPVWATIDGDLNFKTYMGGQPTILSDVDVLGTAHANTITNSKICGDAYYQTIDSSSLNFLNSPSGSCLVPLTPGTAYAGSTDPSLMDMPLSDSNINQWKQEAADGEFHSGDLVLSGDMSFGPGEIDGNLIMSNNNILTITGTIYVTGYIDISNNSAIYCSPSYGLYSCVVVADKWIRLSNNGTFRGSGQPGSYVMLLSNSPCDGISGGDCAGNNSAIEILNNATGAIFYASNGLIYVNNNVQVSELTGRKIHLSNNAVVRYEQGLISASFTSGPGGGWQVVSWREIE